MKSIILVTAHGYPDASVARTFLGTLKASGYTGTIGLITDTLELDYPDVIQIPWDTDNTYFRSSKRLFQYLEFLKRSPVQYDQVITSGIRDVLFQGNPQEMVFSPVSLYREPEGPTLGTCPYNSKWLTNSGYMSDNIRNRGIICAELMIGTHQGMVQLLTAMVDEAERNPRKHDLEDQAILNYMYWNNKLPFATLYQNERSPVYTVGYEPFLRVAPGGKIINHSMQVPTIVHQYDRFITYA